MKDRFSLHLFLVGFSWAFVGWGANALPAEGPPLEALPVAVELRTAALLLSDQQGGELPMVTSTVRRFDDTGEDLRVWLTVELDPVGLQKALPDGGEIEAFFYLMDPRLEVHESLTAGWVLPPTSDLDPVRLVTHFPAPPSGDYVFRILVRADLSFGLRSLPLSIPVFEDVVPTLMEPVLAEPDGPWLRVAPSGRGAGEDSDFPAFVVLRRGDPVEVRFTWTNPEADPGPVKLELEREGLVQTLPLELDRPGKVSEPRTGRAELPTDFAEGRYRLRLVAEGARPSLVSEVAVLDPSLEPTRWTELHRLAEQETVFTGETLEMPEGERRRVLATRAELYRVFGELERGLEPAIARFRALETSLRESAGSEMLPFLHKQLVRVASRLLRRTRNAPEQRLSLVWLLMEHAEEHKSRGRFPLSQVSEKTALEILRAMAEEKDQQSIAADGLAILAGRLQHRRFLDAAEVLLQETLALDGDHPAALSALGAGYERTGRPKEAAEVLRRLVELDPDHGQDRVRAAVALRRAGEYGEALEYLDRVLESVPAKGPVPWWVALAYQEKIRLALDQGRRAAAHGAMREGLARLPEDPVLRLAEPWLRSLAGKREEARELLLELPSAPDQSNARHRFHAWPEERLDVLAEALNRRALAAAPGLSAIAHQAAESLE